MDWPNRMLLFTPCYKELTFWNLKYKLYILLGELEMVAMAYKKTSLGYIIWKKSLKTIFSHFEKDTNFMVLPTKLCQIGIVEEHIKFILRT